MSNALTERPNARTCIFLEEKAEGAVRFYAETIPDTPLDHVQPIGPEMSVLLFGTHFMAMDGNAGFEPRHDHSIVSRKS